MFQVYFRYVQDGFRQNGQVGGMGIGWWRGVLCLMMLYLSFFNMITSVNLRKFYIYTLLAHGRSTLIL